MYEAPNQFDADDTFDASDNATGTLIFMLNGTTPANTNRTFYVYYDTVENGAKEFKTYPTNLTFDMNGGLVTVNNTLLRFFIDTNRGENTSGINRVENYGGTVIIITGANDRTAEYLEYSNTTHNLTFDLINNATFINGSLRVTVEQTGDEVVFGNTSENTNEASVVKKYYVYNNAGPQVYGTFIKVVQRITNDAAYQIQRNSTLSGALALDIDRTFDLGPVISNDSNTANPFSWAQVTGGGGGVIGIANLGQTGTTNYYANSSIDTNGRIGIQLDDTNIDSGSYIEQVSLIYFAGVGGGLAASEFTDDIKDLFVNPINISQSLPELWYVASVPSTNATVYNRNETVLITSNLTTGDPYNLTEYVNATIDMGTGDTGDDQTIILYDDGSHEDGSDNDGIFANSFGISNNANVSVWTINFTFYTNETEFLNYTIHSFNVTDVFNVNTSIINPNPIEGETVFADIDVRNHDGTIYIGGCSLNCSYNSTEVTNKTDYGNGTYSVNFTAPSFGDYLLYCNVSKNGNTGNDTDTFTSETSATNLSIISYPSNVSVTNVTLYDNDSFSITANVTNIGNGTAYSSNISLSLLAGWDADQMTQSCGNINKGNNCTKAFNITVPNGTAPGVYYVNISANWTNPDSSLSGNVTMLNVTVESNPRVNLDRENITSEVSDNYETYVGNFTVMSIGNDALQNITFNCSSGTVCNNFSLSFSPNNISSLNVNQNYSVAVNVTVPLGYPVGTYNGTVNVSAENDGYDILSLYFYLPTKTNVSITTLPTSSIVSNITQEDNETFSFESIAENIGNATASYTNISLGVPTGWYPNSSLENCNNITRGDNCTKAFNITVPNGTAPGVYYVNISANWTNPDSSLSGNVTMLNVTVESNPRVNLDRENITSEVSDNYETYVGNFTVMSIGNDALQNITFNCSSGTVCNNFSLSFSPNNISSLNVNQNYSVAVNVTVPLGYPVGTYNGTVNVSAENDGYDTFSINITPLSNRSWTMSPTYCEKAEEPAEGIACAVNVSNNGNDIINFTVYPENGNYTKANETNFSVNNGENHTLVVTYNVTDVAPAIYNSTFTIDAVQSDATPDNMTLQVSLLPNIPPLMEYLITPNFTEQNNSIEIFVNLTDRSNTNISWMNISVTDPSNFTNQSSMTLLNMNGNFSQWYLNYTDTLGNTSLQGVYNVSLSSSDQIGNIGNISTNFTIYKKTLVTASTLSNTYYQGDRGSLYFVIKNTSGYGLNNSNVTFNITDPSGNLSYYYQEQTNSEGTITPMPTFTLASDAPIGSYNLLANYSFYDDVLNQTIYLEKNSTFDVESRTVTVTGLFADLETSVAWYPDNIMKFGILVYNGEGRPVDPDEINLTVYDPADNLYFTTSLSSMTHEATGYYTYSHAMSASSPVGMYLGVLNASQGTFQTTKLKAFRVSQGGPYDVRLNLFENEVGQGDYLDFQIIIENKGEVTQDVFVVYNVTGNGQNYYSFSEAVLTPAFSNQSFTRSAYIYSDQLAGTYTLNARVTYSAAQPSIDANTTFAVVASQIVNPPAPTVVGETPTYYTIKPTSETDADILITEYNNNISLARGITKIERVVVKNTGRVNLNNVSLFLLGAPTDWFNITPEVYDNVVPGNSSVFLIEFNIPENAKEGRYEASLLASSGVVSDQKGIEINVYRFFKTLLEDEIEKLEEDLINLKVDIKIAENQGKNVSDVLLIVDTIESYMGIAKDNIGNNELEDAMEKITSSVTLIGKARDLLATLEIAGPEELPLFIILIILILLIVIIFVLIYLWRKKKLKQKLMPYINRIKGLFKKPERKEEEIERWQKEKEKAFRMLKILENEKNEGLITDITYRRMKDSLERKINKIEKKLK